MKKTVCSVLSLAAVLLAGMSVSAEEGLLYGTMEIPFAQFYAEEGVSYEVDAVSSCTESKWFSDSLATGGYSVAHEEDKGTASSSFFFLLSAIHSGN